MEELLHKFRIDRKTLTADELETLDKWAKALSTAQLTLHDLQNYVQAMIDSIERELVGHNNPPMTFANLFFRSRRERHLKARLENYVMLRDFLQAPEKARSYIEKQLNGFTGAISQKVN